jgi:hypothetical protein
LDVELFQSRTVSGEAIEVGRLDAAAMVAEIFPSQIVGRDVENVWFRSVCSADRPREDQDRRDQGGQQQSDLHSDGSQRVGFLGVACLLSDGW